MTKGLPKYFEEYLDEKFNGINVKLDSMNDHLIKLNGTVASNKSNIQKICFALVVGSAVWIKESRDYIISFIRLYQFYLIFYLLSFQYTLVVSIHPITKVWIDIIR